MPFREGPATRGPTRLCELLGPGGSLEDRALLPDRGRFNYKLTSVRASRTPKPHSVCQVLFI